MRASFTSLQLPSHPLLRALALVGVALVVIGLVAIGFVVGAAVLAIAALVLAIRRWLSRRAAGRGEPAIIEGEFTVVPARPPADLPRPE